ncbi:hypothetical protein K8R61_00865 [bacterium]|nr:hypothetical protein [bacterium]
MESANILDIIKKRKSEKRMSPSVRKKIFGIEIYSQHFIRKVLVSFIKIVAQEKELTIKVHEIPNEMKPAVISIQIGNEIIWKYSCGNKEDLNERTILYQYQDEYLLKILKGGSTKNVISVTGLVAKHLLK